MNDLLASHKVMQHYLSDLLAEEPALAEETQTLSEVVIVDDPLKQELNRLLAGVDEQKTKADVAVENLLPRQAEPVSDTTAAESVSEYVKTEENPLTTQRSPYKEAHFQALLFNVAGLKVAIPLETLGGIHLLGSINTVPANPVWFSGIMLHREQKISVVDTARWVMPEKYDKTLAEKLNYQYVIMLGNSNWGLSCETLINTTILQTDDVKWRENAGKRPWMAGLLKKHMCILIDTNAMIDMLDKGLDIQS